MSIRFHAEGHHRNEIQQPVDNQHGPYKSTERPQVPARRREIVESVNLVLMQCRVHKIVAHQTLARTINGWKEKVMSFAFAFAFILVLSNLLSSKSASGRTKHAGGKMLSSSSSSPTSSSSSS